MVAYVLAVLAAVGLVGAAALMFRLAGKGTDDRGPGGLTAGHAGAMVSALFLLVFAIAVVVPWTTADAARRNTQAESRAVVDAYWAAAGLPSVMVGPVRTGLREYVTFVVEDEWPLMARGRLDPMGGVRLDELRSRITELASGDEEQREARAALLGQLGAIGAARAQRAADAAATPPSGLLALTVLTGMAVILLPFLAGARPRGTTLVPLVAMAALLGLGVYLTWDITRAFDGPLAVTPDAYTTALHEFARITGGV
ncbi:DUF4239 domain-containing protein [Nonomuraea sp. MCN248]|uniref:DUF4239 domain-containing protein n=1 Tax=Nonomuraea corallina TaxID=2989783 RepID=A0ABT4SBC9_9ACTN|nr:DUF4239 domain-containing protein [Nonomuraea corallina]MDA0634512.1 DUF4239 domain-containing protein [Nonomuraea corallina]